ncbi:MAG: ATPase, partial [Actinomycetota bacterium]
MTVESVSRPKDSDRKTRVHLSFYDRIKFLIFFGIVFFVLVWADMAGDETLSFEKAVVDSAGQRWWIFPLVAIEALRQTHFLISELAAPYHGIWQRYFSFVDRLVHRLSDWTRFRLSRVIKWAVIITLLSIVLGAIYKETPVRALFLAPKALWSALPIIGQLMFAV